MNERHAEALREAAAEYLAREANRNYLITVTRTQFSESGKRAIVYITVFPDSGEKQALEFANRNRGEVGKFLSERTRGVRLPQIEFQIDVGDKHRRRLDELS
jgi:ribosome-binding factor A